MQSVTRIDDVAALLMTRDPGHPVRVGIDGPCGAGKSTAARALVARVRAAGRAAIHVDSDGLHRVRAIRWRQGRDSARGYYEDAYDFDAVRDRVLRPLGPTGDRRYAVRVHDLATDAVLDERAVAPHDAVVVFDATFLQRGALRDLWDDVVLLDVPLQVATERAVARDADALGGEEAARRAHTTRYEAAWRIYTAEEAPRARASIVLTAPD